MKISEPTDAYEQEADAIADQVMKMSDSMDCVMPMTATNQTEGAYRKCTACEMKEEEKDDERSKIS
jgi:hypothetical protein